MRNNGQGKHIKPFSSIRLINALHILAGNQSVNTDFYGISYKARTAALNNVNLCTEKGKQ